MARARGPPSAPWAALAEVFPRHFLPRCVPKAARAPAFATLRVALGPAHACPRDAPAHGAASRADPPATIAGFCVRYLRAEAFSSVFAPPLRNAGSECGLVGGIFADVKW